MAQYQASKLFLRAVPAAFKRVSGAILTSVYKRAAKVAGKGLRIGAGVYISHPESISFGDNVLIEGPARFSSEVKNSSLVFCDGVQINRDVFLDYSGGLTLGAGVLISEGAMVYTHDHQLDPRSRPNLLEKRIGENAWIGARAIILSGCTEIGVGAIVAAGAVATRNVAVHSIVAGNPARLIRTLNIDA